MASKTKAKPKKDAAKANGEALEVRGERVLGIALTASGAVELNGNGPLDRNQEFAFVARAKVGKLHVEDVKNVPTLKLVSKIRHATLVTDALVEDIVNEQAEELTGQLRLLSFEGETRRAARLAAEARRGLVDEADDEDKFEPGDFCDLALEDLGIVRAAWAKGDAEGTTVPELMAEVEAGFVAVAARALGGVEWARRQTHAHNEAERAAREAEAVANARKAADAAAVHSNEEADKAERRGLGTDAETE